MTVRELMEALAKMPQDARVTFPDTYTQCEGWGPGHNDACLVASSVALIDGEVFINGYEEEDEDLINDYEDEDEDAEDWDE